MTVYRQLYRWHLWLGWLVGVPLILWTLSGLFMVLKPIEEVRGEHLRATPPAIAATALRLPPAAARRDLAGLRLIAPTGRPVWAIERRDDAIVRYDATSGAALGTLDAAEARASLAHGYRGAGPLVALRHYSAGAAPGDLRRDRPVWQARMADGTHVYIDAQSGELIAVRTAYWRAYDLMWGIHIMDLQTREDSDNPVLKLFAALALASLVMAFAILILRQRRVPRERR